MSEMSCNAYLCPSLGRLLIGHARIGHTFFKSRTDRMKRNLKLSMEHHDGFIAALAARDETAVVDLVFDHRESSRETIEAFIAPEGLKADVAPDVQATRVMEKAGFGSKASAPPRSRPCRPTGRSTRAASTTSSNT